MGACRLCGKQGLFTVVSPDGFCKNCESTINLKIRYFSININDNIKSLENLKSIDKKLERCNTIIDFANSALEYENMGLATFEPQPSQIIKDYTEMKDTIIIESLSDEFSKIKMKSDITSSVTTAINSAAKLLVNISERKSKLSNKKGLDDLESSIQKYLHDLKLNEYLEAAKKSEFKGQTSKALDQYKEALYFLKTDKIDDAKQQEIIASIENKISELSK